MAQKKHTQKQITLKHTHLMIAGIILFTVFAMIGSLFIVTVANNNHRIQTIADSEKQAAGQLKQMALDAFNQKKYSESKALYNAARLQYVYLVDHTDDQTIKNFANQEKTDCEAQIWLIENNYQN